MNTHEAESVPYTEIPFNPANQMTSIIASKFLDPKWLFASQLIGTFKLLVDLLLLYKLVTYSWGPSSQLNLLKTWNHQDQIIIWGKH